MKTMTAANCYYAYEAIFQYEEYSVYEVRQNQDKQLVVGSGT